jgi:hypothetical protein
MRTLLLIAYAWALATCSAAAETLTDPFEYCAAVGTIDFPDQSFKGHAPLSQAARDFDINVRAYPQFGDQSVVWRCFKGAVMACVQLNYPVCGRANISKVPTREMSAFCRSQHNSPMIPLAVMGHEHPSMYNWGCRQGIATIVEQFFTPDERGFSPDEWKKLSR